MKAKLFLIPLLFLSFHSFATINIKTVNPTTHPDYNALVAFYNATKGDEWTINTNWLDPTKPINTWYGITEENGRVTEIDLQENNFYPNLPGEIGELTELKRLRVTNSSIPSFPIFNSLPSSLCNLSKLEYFQIQSLNIAGDLSVFENCTFPNLIWVDIRNNFFEGKIPTNITSNTNLQVLLLNNNRLSGSLPDFTNLNSLNYLWIQNNNFQFGDLEPNYTTYRNSFDYKYSPQKLLPARENLGVPIGEYFTLEVNDISGSDNGYYWYRYDTDSNSYVSVGTGNPFQHYIYDQEDYGNYKLYIVSGIIPDLSLETETFEIGEPASNHPDYDALIAIYNSLNGQDWETPWDLNAPITKWDTSVGNNSLTFDNTTNRVIQLLFYNEESIIGTIPEEIGNISELKKIFISNCSNISGEIPKKIGILSKLEELDLRNNNLSGNIPSDLGELTNLKVLRLNNNNLSGIIPTSLGNLNNLTELYLGKNNLFGNIPTEIGSLKKLEKLHLFNNNLSGNIPNSIWNLNKLKNLTLGFQQSEQLQLPNGIPTEIANLTELEWLNLSYIPLSFPLQPELYNLPKLSFLRLYGCGLEGNLPAALAKFSNLLIFDNKLEGPIPEEFINNGGSRLDIHNNYFDFSDLQPLVEANNYEVLIYSPQRTKDTAIETTIALGEDITMTVDNQGINRSKHIQKHATSNVYQWYKDGENISGATSNSYTITNASTTDSGVYFCRITNTVLPDLIIQRANITISVGSSASINDLELNQKIKVYPNPTNSNFTIQLNGIETVKASLFDVNGREVLKKIINQLDEIDISNLKSGIYILNLTDKNKKVTKRIIKM